jgi:succinate dehydrogenase flavin-adding protein (antitoxin of CptAB toxin-antitoxin module)
VPKAFHGVSSFKHKDFQHTLNKRDELLMEWALAHTNLTPKAIEAWIATLDIEDTNQQFIE